MGRRDLEVMMHVGGRGLHAVTLVVLLSISGRRAIFFSATQQNSHFSESLLRNHCETVADMTIYGSHFVSSARDVV